MSFASSTCNVRDISLRRRNNRINKIKNNAGRWLDSREDIGEAFYENLRKIISTIGPIDLSEIKDLINLNVTREDNRNQISIPSETRIRKAVFQIGALKSLGRDGYPAKLIINMSGSIDNDITSLVQDFFKHKHSLRKINKTFSVYISKEKKKHQTSKCK